MLKRVLKLPIRMFWRMLPPDSYSKRCTGGEAIGTTLRSLGWPEMKVPGSGVLMGTVCCMCRAWVWV